MSVGIIAQPFPGILEKPQSKEGRKPKQMRQREPLAEQIIATPKRIIISFSKHAREKRKRRAQEEAANAKTGKERKKLAS